MIIVNQSGIEWKGQSTRFYKELIQINNLFKNIRCSNNRNIQR